MKRDDAELDRILARGHMGGPRHDEILRRVLDQTAAPAPRAPRRWLALALAPGAALAAGLAAWLIVARPAPPAFTPKGPEGALPPAAVNVGCGATGAHVCRVGDTLMFTVNTAVTSGYLGAYADPPEPPPGAGAPARRGERIWYFPTATGAAPVIAAGSGTQVLSDGIRIGPEHRPGLYRVTVWISRVPLARADADAAGPGVLNGRSTFDLQVSE